MYLNVAHFSNIDIKTGSNPSPAPWSKVLLEKLKLTPHVGPMELKGVQPLDPILIFKIHFNIIQQFMFRSPKWSPPFMLCDEDSYSS
jgi:hypothetical protein